jgi:hypothetical protein
VELYTAEGGDPDSMNAQLLRVYRAEYDAALADIKRLDPGRNPARDSQSGVYRQFL